jgi:hypothetical protein
VEGRNSTRVTIAPDDSRSPMWKCRFPTATPCAQPPGGGGHGESVQSGCGSGAGISGDCASTSMLSSRQVPTTEMQPGTRFAANSVGTA